MSLDLDERYENRDCSAALFAFFAWTGCCGRRRRGSVALVPSPARNARTSTSTHASSSRSLEYNPPPRPLSPPESPRGGPAGTSFSSSSAATAAGGAGGNEQQRRQQQQQQQSRSSGRRRQEGSSLEGTPLLSKADAAAAAGSASSSSLASASEAIDISNNEKPPRQQQQQKLRISTDDDDGDDDVCPTCLERFTEENPRTLLEPCGHSFHLGCALEWEERCVGSLGMVAATCPVCAAPVPEQTP